MAAPKGNQNAAKAKVWSAAIERALEAKSKAEGKAAIDDLARKLIDLCMEGDLAALREFGDRMDGKPKQQIEASGPDGGPIQVMDPSKLSDAELAAIAAGRR